MTLTSFGIAIVLAFNCFTVSLAIRRHPSFFIQDVGNRNDLGNQNENDQIMQQIIDSTFSSKSHNHRRKLSSNLQHQRPEDHLVTDLPYLDNGVFTTKHYAGHIPASHDDDKKFFYWLFEPDFSDVSEGLDETEIPLLIWLNGGPGCSSMDGLFLENGPIRLEKTNDKDKAWTFRINEHSWHKSPAYVLYIDQPVGTGLSFTKSRKYCKNDLEVNIDFHLFLENFLLMYEDLFLDKDGNSAGDENETTSNIVQRTMSRPLYFSGESHAGHYIPSMMDYILQRNDDTSKKTSPRVKINLKGAAIGNGWIDPYYQYAAAELAYSIGMIDLAQKETLDYKEKVCRDNLQHGNYRSGICFDLLDDIINDSSGKAGKVKLSIYDNRKWEHRGQAREFPPGHKDVEAYLGGWNQNSVGMTVDYKDVLKALHAEESIDANQRFLECTDPPYIALQHQDGKGVVKEFINVLEHETKPKMLIFNGMNDMICNHVGNEKLLDNLNWKHVKEWTLAKRYAWTYKSDFVSNIDDKSYTSGPAGYYKEYDNLIFLKIATSGHMVPMDLPDTALEMMRKLMFQESFAGNFQSLDGKVPHETADCPSCPTCNSEQKSFSSQSEDDDDDVEEADQSRILFTKDFVSGGWFGAVIGISLMIIFNVVGRKRAYSRDQLTNNVDSDMNVYRDDPETELVLTSRKNDSEVI